jgi:hypothetical protein
MTEQYFQKCRKAIEVQLFKNNRYQQGDFCIKRDKEDKPRFVLRAQIFVKSYWVPRLDQLVDIVKMKSGICDCLYIHGQVQEWASKQPAYDFLDLSMEEIYLAYIMFTFAHKKWANRSWEGI